MPSSPETPERIDLAAFIAILVVGILLISVAGIDPLVVKTIADLAAVYLTWRIASRRRQAKGGPDLDLA